jgi:hypothetical protein
MNVKNRISKLEKQVNPSEFCNCIETPKTEIRFPEKENGDEATSIVDVCNRCRKTVKKIIIEIVSAL